MSTSTLLPLSGRRPAHRTAVPFEEGNVVVRLSPSGEAAPPQRVVDASGALYRYTDDAIPTFVVTLEASAPMTDQVQRYYVVRYGGRYFILMESDPLTPRRKPSPFIPASSTRPEMTAAELSRSLHEIVLLEHRPTRSIT